MRTKNSDLIEAKRLKNVQNAAGAILLIKYLRCNLIGKLISLFRPRRCLAFLCFLGVVQILVFIITHIYLHSWYGSFQVAPGLKNRKWRDALDKVWMMETGYWNYYRRIRYGNRVCFFFVFLPIFDPNFWGKVSIFSSLSEVRSRGAKTM